MNAIVNHLTPVAFMTWSGSAGRSRCRGRRAACLKPVPPEPASVVTETALEAGELFPAASCALTVKE